MSPKDEADLRRLVLDEFRRDQHVMASCHGKDRFPSFDHAIRVARAMNRRNDECTEPYHCLVCDSWHVGTVDRKKRLAMNRRMN